jgi:ATP-dependent DNA helicase RecG
MGRYNLDTQLNKLFGVNAERVAALERLECRTIWDLLNHFPKKHLDRREFTFMDDIRQGAASTIIGKVTALDFRRYSYRKRSQLLVCITDEKGNYVNLIWFNQPFLANQFEEGQTLLVSGKVDYKDGYIIYHP